MDHPARDRITDPQRIRALAHPVRLQIIDLLGETPTLTATRCAELTGETVANCSFHLRTLGKYGYVEPAPREGRERPWQLVNRSLDMRLDPDAPGAPAAVGDIALLHAERELDHARRWLDRLAAEDPAWVNSSTVTTSTTWATREELAEVSETLQRITERFTGRDTDPSKRPDGARPIRVFATTVVDVAREERAR